MGPVVVASVESHDAAVTVSTANTCDDRIRLEARIESVENVEELAKAEIRKGYPKKGSLSRSRRDVSGWCARRVVSYIESNFATRIRVRDLARVACLSNSRFSHWFHEAFGLPPIVYLARFRMLRAKQLMLADGARPLSQIALECGMCDHPHFSRMFRRVFGMTPTHWRRTHTSHFRSHSDVPPKALRTEQ